MYIIMVTFDLILEKNNLFDNTSYVVSNFEELFLILFKKTQRTNISNLFYQRQINTFIV